MHNRKRSHAILLGDDARDLDFAGRDVVKRDISVAKRGKHSARHTHMTLHARADDRDFRESDFNRQFARAEAIEDLRRRDLHIGEFAMVNRK